MNKGGFSWKKLSGLSGVKSNLSKKIGIPLTKSGRNQKVGKFVSKGCLMNYFFAVLGLFLMISLSQCEDKETVTSSNTSSCNSFEDRLIMKYVDSLNLNPTITEECIYYITTIESNSGIYPDTNSTVKIHYRVYSLNGDVHDDSYSRGEPSTFPLAEIIKGMKLGIIEMQVGESSTFIIPSKYGWGEEGLGSIPPNEILVIDVDLLEII